MKLFANMNKRDRGLLMVILVAVIFYISYSLIITPELIKREVLKSELDASNLELERINTMLIQADALEKQASDLKEGLSGKYAVFFGDLNQAQLIHRLDTLMLGAGIPVNAYTPLPQIRTQVTLDEGAYELESYPLLDLAKEIAPALHEDKSSGGAAENTEGMTSDVVPSTDITFGFESASYGSIYAFISATEQMNKTVLLKSIDIERRDGGLAGQLVFGFYGLPALEENHQGELRFTPVLPKGKTDPFQ